MTTQAEVRLLVPGLPPSVNRTLRAATARYTGAKAAAYRQTVWAAFRASHPGQKALSGDVQVELSLWPGDRRRRDIDNGIKATLDALRIAGVYRDDSQVVALNVALYRFCKARPEGWAETRPYHRIAVIPLQEWPDTVQALAQ